MRILFVGDSLALPRPERMNNYSPNEKKLAVSYHETYSSIVNYNLVNKYHYEPFIEVINRAKRFYTIKNIKDEFVDHLFFFEPDIVIMQVGIVDCWFREQLNGKQMVDISEFGIHLEKMIKMLKLRPNVKLIIVGIAPTSEKMDRRYKGLNKEISRYNDILRSYVNYKTVFYIHMEEYINTSVPHEYLLPDDHHLNKAGNKLIAGLLTSLIDGFILSNLGVRQYEKGNIEGALQFFSKSFECYPAYIDNLYNLLVLTYQSDNVKELERLIDFIESENLFSLEINEFLNFYNQIDRF